MRSTAKTAKKPKIGLALGAGGARGLAHIGVLKALERAGIVPDFIVGSSIGALVGAAYAVNPDAAALELRVAEVLGSKGWQKKGFKRLTKANRGGSVKSDLFDRMVGFAAKEMFLNLVLLRKALLSEKDLMECVTPFVCDIDLTETRIPFATAAVDLVSGRKVVLKEGSLIKAVMASCAVPGFMPPIPWNDMLLVDGGVIEAVPSAALGQTAAEVIIGVDVGVCICRPPDIWDGIDAIHRVTEIMSFYLSTGGRQLVDILIKPDVQHIHWTDFLKYEELIELGETATNLKWVEIIGALRRSRWKKIIHRVFPMLPGSYARIKSENFPRLESEQPGDGNIHNNQSKKETGDGENEHGFKKCKGPGYKLRAGGY